MAALPKLLQTVQYTQFCAGLHLIHVLITYKAVIIPLIESRSHVSIYLYHFSHNSTILK